MQGLRIGFVLLPGFLALAYSAFLETIQFAADSCKKADSFTWSLWEERDTKVLARSGKATAPVVSPMDPHTLDFVVVVGGEHSATRLSKARAAYIREAFLSGAVLVGLESGALLLAQMGLLHGKHCCVNTHLQAQAQISYPSVRVRAQVPYLVDRNCWTGIGGIGAMHLAVQVVSYWLGEDARRTTLRAVTGEPEGLRAEYVALRKIRSRHVRAAVTLIEEKPNLHLSPDWIAQRLGLGIRQLERLFKAEMGCTPSTYAQRVRLEYARERIVNTNDLIIDIAMDAGFTNASHFSMRFRKHFGLSPTVLREQTRTEVS